MATTFPPRRVSGRSPESMRSGFTNVLPADHREFNSSSSKTAALLEGRRDVVAILNIFGKPKIGETMGVAGKEKRVPGALTLETSPDAPHERLVPGSASPCPASSLPHRDGP